MSRNFVVLLVPGAAVDEHEPIVVLDENAAHAERDAVALVGGDAALPERLGHDAEHRAAVELLSARLQRVDAEAAYGARFDQRLRRAHAVVSLSIGRGIATRPREPRAARHALAHEAAGDHPSTGSRGSRASSSRRSSTCAVATASPAARWRARISTP